VARHWLITGATGLLAPYLVEACRRDGMVVTTARSGGDHPCDLRDTAATRALLADVAPDVIVHAAGLTDVDRCERESAEAYASNRDAAAGLANALPESARLVAISTDQVYPDTAGPHREDAVGPVNVYGKSKIAGEQASLRHGKTIVLRTNFFGPSRRDGRQSLSDFVVRSLTERRPVTLFEDVLFSPLHMATLADLVVEVVECGLVGVFNAGCRDGDTKAAFGLAVAQHKGLQTDMARLGRSSELPDRAPRAHDLRLDVARLEGAVGRPMPTLHEEIAKL
jgi:dTDP-4-dehydrorhamnose reductase